MTGDPLDSIFGALADPTRRDLLRRLVRDGPDTATRLTTATPLTRQAVTKHLRALVDAGLATTRRSGREVEYVATPERMAAAVAWMAEAGPSWDRRLDRLASRSARR